MRIPVQTDCLCISGWDLSRNNSDGYFSETRCGKRMQPTNATYKGCSQKNETQRTV